MYYFVNVQLYYKWYSAMIVVQRAAYCLNEYDITVVQNKTTF